MGFIVVEADHIRIYFPKQAQFSLNTSLLDCSIKPEWKDNLDAYTLTHSTIHSENVKHMVLRDGRDTRQETN